MFRIAVNLSLVLLCSSFSSFASKLPCEIRPASKTPVQEKSGVLAHVLLGATRNSFVCCFGVER